MEDDVSLVGFGEAGQTFAAAGQWGKNARVYDRLTDHQAMRAAKETDYVRVGVRGAASLEGAIEGGKIVLSLVTADQALQVAHSAVSFVESEALYCDMNSVAPETKRAAAAEIEAAGAHYVDVAIMAPVNPARLEVLLLISGGEAEIAASRLAELGFANVRIVGLGIGQASSIKMIRSVIVKGTEALAAEAMLAAHAAGVAEEVIASLDASETNQGWAQRADYYLDRMIVHGLRRADEMEEAVKTLEDFGVDPLLARATAQRQREIGNLGLRAPGGLAEKLDQISARKGAA